jgi:hypothetical protein
MNSELDKIFKQIVMALIKELIKTRKKYCRMAGVVPQFRTKHRVRVLITISAANSHYTRTYCQKIFSCTEGYLIPSEIRK